MTEPMNDHEHEMLFRREEIATRVAEIGAQIESAKPLSIEHHR